MTGIVVCFLSLLCCCTSSLSRTETPLSLEASLPASAGCSTDKGYCYFKILTILELLALAEVLILHRGVDLTALPFPVWGLVRFLRVGDVL